MIMIISECRYTIDGILHLCGKKKPINFEALSVAQKSNINEYIRSAKIKKILVSYSRFLLISEQIDLLDMIEKNPAVMFIIIYDMQQSPPKDYLKISSNIIITGKNFLTELFNIGGGNHLLEGIDDRDIFDYSQREKDVASLLFTGNSLLQISQDLKIAKTTLFTHISNMKTKSKFKSIQQLFYLYRIQRRLSII